MAVAVGVYHAEEFIELFIGIVVELKYSQNRRLAMWWFNVSPLLFATVAPILRTAILRTAILRTAILRTATLRTAILRTATLVDSPLGLGLGTSAIPLPSSAHFSSLFTCTHNRKQHSREDRTMQYIIQYGHLR
jgi:hypothetical protein